MTKVQNLNSFISAHSKTDLSIRRQSALEFNIQENLSTLESHMDGSSKRKPLESERVNRSFYKVLLVPGLLPSLQPNKNKFPTQNQNDSFFPILVYSNPEKNHTSLKPNKSEPKRKIINTLSSLLGNTRKGRTEKIRIEQTGPLYRVQEPAIKSFNKFPYLSERYRRLTGRQMEKENNKSLTTINLGCVNSSTQISEGTTNEIIRQTKQETLKLNHFNLWKKDKLLQNGPKFYKSRRKNVRESSMSSLSNYSSIRNKPNGSITYE